MSGRVACIAESPAWLVRACCVAAGAQADAHTPTRVSVLAAAPCLHAAQRPIPQGPPTGVLADCAAAAGASRLPRAQVRSAASCVLLPGSYTPSQTVWMLVAWLMCCLQSAVGCLLMVCSLALTT